MSGGTLVFAVPDYAYLGEAVCREGGFERGGADFREFPDGERAIRLVSRAAGRDAVIVGGTVSDRATLDLFDLACGLVREGCRTLTLLLPFFGYSTMERAVRPGDVVTAKNRARLLSAIPPAPGGSRVALLDLHAEGIAYYFEGGIVPTHLYAKPLVLDAARSLGWRGFSLACVDSGRAKWVESLANDLGTAASFVFKRRLSGRKTEVIAVSAEVAGRPVVIYDDMVRTGESLINAARAYRRAGASMIAAVVTHGLFPGGALGRLKASGLLERIICTDSHPRARAQRKSPFLTVVSTAGLFAGFLRGASQEA